MDWRLGLYRNAHAAQRGRYGFTSVLSVREGLRARADIARCPLYAATPLRELSAAAAIAGVERVYYKDEASRFGLGSFKALGGAYAVARLLCDLLTTRLGAPVAIEALVDGSQAELTSAVTVVCASDGNHGRSVAAGAARFGCRCVIFLHEGVSAGRERAITELGAQVVRTAGDYDTSVEAAALAATKNGWRLVGDTSSRADDPMPALVMQGYCVMILEVLEQLAARGEPPPTHVFLQGGVGGLAAAAVAHLWEALGPDEAPVFVVVEPDRADCLYQSARKGRPTLASGDLDTIMAGLSCGEVSQVAWPILHAAVEFFLTIEDAAAIDCMRLLHQGALGGGAIIAGESAVAGLAALLSAGRDPGHAASLRLTPRSRILLIGTEGATDPELYRALVGAAPRSEPA